MKLIVYVGLRDIIVMTSENEETERKNFIGYGYNLDEDYDRQEMPDNTARISFSPVVS